MVPAPGYSINIGFADFDLYDNYLVGTIHEGVLFDVPHINKFHEIFDRHYYNRPFGYISNRKFDYTINPNCYSESKKYNSQLVGVATLCYSENTFKMASFAEEFLAWPHKAFYTMEECRAWIDKQLELYKKADL